MLLSIILTNYINYRAQVDEDEEGGLRALAEVLLGYGERQFDGPPGQQGSRRGVWAGVLLMCGQFERVSDTMICIFIS